MKHLTLMLILLPVTSYAWDLSPEIYATSWHNKDKPSGESYNQRNPGIGFSLTNPVSDHWKAGVRMASYKNSIDKQSNYGAFSLDYCRGDDFHICGGAMAGAVTGYGAVRPLAAPVMGLGYDRVTINLTAFPIAKATGVAVSGWVSYKAVEF